MSKKNQEMMYDEVFDRWISRMAGEEKALHCGENLKIYAGGYLIPCRLEMARDWYVIMDGARFDLRKTDKYIIQIR